jgi:hypothetical protein
MARWAARMAASPARRLPVLCLPLAMVGFNCVACEAVGVGLMGVYRIEKMTGKRGLGNRVPLLRKKCFGVKGSILSPVWTWKWY